MPLLDFKNYKVYYEVTGSGKPILLLNGIMMSTKSWDILLPNFIANNTLIRVDFLDQGQSSRIDKDYDQSIQVELVVALLKHLNISKINVVGISYGAEVAQLLAISHPNIIERLVLANTTAFTNDWLKDIGKQWNMAASTGNGQLYYYTTIPYIYSPDFYHSRIEWMKNREKILVPLFSNIDFLKALTRLTNSANNFDVRSKLSNIKKPTLIIGSDNDLLTPFKEQERIAELISGSKIVKITNCGHASMYEQPAVFMSLVLGFINLEKYIDNI